MDLKLNGKLRCTGSLLHQLGAQEASKAVQDARDEIESLRAALSEAEAALADIGDADRESGHDLAWCEKRAEKALPCVRSALAA